MRIPCRYRDLQAETPFGSGRLGMGGALSLEFKKKHGKTVLTQKSQSMPLYVNRALYPEEHNPGMAHVYLVNPTGGIVQGDRLKINIEIGEDCCLHLTTQSATKIYRMEMNCAVTEYSFSLHKNSYCEFLPDPVIPFKGSRYFQEIHVDMDKRATFFYWDILHPGRYTRGEEFEYDVYFSSLKIYHNYRPLLVDRILIEPYINPPRRLGVLGPNKFLASLYVVSPSVSGISKKLDEVGISHGVQGSVLVARILGSEWLANRKKLFQAYRAVRKECLNSELPPARKY